MVGMDWRPTNPSVQAINCETDAKAQAMLANQQADLIKAAEDFATLFGVSLDFAKDIQSWAGQQSAFVLLSEGKAGMQPVFITTSRDSAAANAALEKLLAPWQRIGEVNAQPDQDYPIIAFKMPKEHIEVYASAFGQVVAISPSKDALKHALAGKGFEPGSPADRIIKTFSDSMLYAYADPKLAAEMDLKNVPIPVSAVGLGISAVPTGMKLQVIGLLNEQVTAMMQQMGIQLAPGTVVVNPGIPSGSLAAASILDLNSVAGALGMMKLGSGHGFQLEKLLQDTQASVAITAVLPTPTGVAAFMAPSADVAKDKLGKIIEQAKKLKLYEKTDVGCGSVCYSIKTPHGWTMYVTQTGNYILLAKDKQALNSAVATISGNSNPLVASTVYKETMACLGNSNVLTVYVSLAPLQGIGYLGEGLGVGDVQPIYGTLAKSLENMQALGLGIGLNGDTASVTLFLRAKPGMMPGAGIASASVAAIGAAVLFPVFGSARHSARMSHCDSNLEQLAVALRGYIVDHNGKLPTAANWRSELEEYAEDIDMSCPDGDTVYAFNKNLGGLSINRIKNPSEVVVFFEASADLPNAAGSRANAELPHDGKGFFAYLSADVKSLSQVPPQSQWVPKYEKAKPTKKATSKKTVRKHKK